MFVHMYQLVIMDVTIAKLQLCRFVNKSVCRSHIFTCIDQLLLTKDWARYADLPSLGSNTYLTLYITCFFLHQLVECNHCHLQLCHIHLRKGLQNPSSRIGMSNQKVHKSRYVFLCPIDNTALILSNLFEIGTLSPPLASFYLKIKCLLLLAANT